MKKKLIFSSLFLLASVFAFAQSADEIVNKYIDAMGGKDKIANIKTMKMVATVDVGPNMKAPITMYIVNNKSYRFDLELQGMKMSRALDGDNGWYISPWAGKKDAEKMNEEEIRDAKDQADITGSLFDYKAKG